MGQSDQRHLRISTTILGNFHSIQTYFFLKINWITIALNFLKFNGIPVSIGIFEPFKCYQEAKIVSLQQKILRLTEANKQLKKNKMPPEAPDSSSWLVCLRFCLQHHLVSLLGPHGQALPLEPSSSSLPMHPLYPKFPWTNFLIRTSPFLWNCPHSLFLWTC